MIKANELRIGNWVSLNSSKNVVTKQIVAWFVVGCNEHNCSIRLGDIETIQEQSYYTINPIPLTPEILEKAGFAQNEHNEFYKNITVDEWRIALEETDKWDVWYGPYEFWKDRLIMCSINYVHQLQNLYFALTGEELEINL